jgi:hypothetical protein
MSGAGTGLWTRAFATWFDAEIIALEPSSGMRDVGTEIGLPPRAYYVAASAQHLPFGSPSIPGRLALYSGAPPDRPLRVRHGGYAALSWMGLR